MAEDAGLIIGTFTGLTFSGYTTNGLVVINEVCFYNNTLCKVASVYAVTEITANNWFYGINGGNGIIGVGPNSPFVRQFIDPFTNTQTYSIVVGRGSQ
jgi:hypothetical protein